MTPHIDCVHCLILVRRTGFQNRVKTCAPISLGKVSQRYDEFVT